MTAQRKHDIVVFGATSFVGQILCKYLVDTFQLCRQQLSALRVRIFDHLYLGAIGEEDVDILLCDFWIDKATKTQFKVGTHLCQPDTSIAGTAFYDEGIGINFTGLQRTLNNGNAGTILGTAARIQIFQLCKTVRM